MRYRQETPFLLVLLTRSAVTSPIIVLQSPLNNKVPVINVTRCEQYAPLSHSELIHRSIIYRHTTSFASLTSRRDVSNGNASKRFLTHESNNFIARKFNTTVMDNLFEIMSLCVCLSEHLFEHVVF